MGQEDVHDLVPLGPGGKAKGQAGYGLEVALRGTDAGLFVQLADGGGADRLAVVDLAADAVVFARGKAHLFVAQQDLGRGLPLDQKAEASRSPHPTVQPPSMVIPAPVTKLEASLARNSDQAADLVQLAPAAQRDLGGELGILFGVVDQAGFISVAKGPGRMALTVMPYGAHSRARVRVSCRTAPLLLA